PTCYQQCTEQRMNQQREREWAATSRIAQIEGSAGCDEDQEIHLRLRERPVVGKRGMGTGGALRHRGRHCEGRTLWFCCHGGVANRESACEGDPLQILHRFVGLIQQYSKKFLTQTLPHRPLPTIAGKKVMG